MAQRGRAEWHIGSSARAFIYSICHKAYPTAGALLCTSTRLLIQVAIGTMDSLHVLQAECSASWEVHDWACVRAACLLNPQERRQSITLFSLCMHITRRLCQAGRACICPLATREGEQRCFGPRELANASHTYIHLGKVHATTASDAHSRA